MEKKMPKGQFHVGRSRMGTWFTIARLRLTDDPKIGWIVTKEDAPDYMDRETEICTKQFLPLIRGQKRIPKGRQAIVKITVTVVKLLPKE